MQTAAGQAKEAAAQALRSTANVRIAEAQVAQAGAQADSATAQVAQAQAQLDLLHAGSRPEDIAASEAAVAQAEAAVTAARNALADAILRPPFAGTVGAVLVDAGELVTPQTPVIRLGDLTRLRVWTEGSGRGRREPGACWPTSPHHHRCPARHGVPGDGGPYYPRRPVTCEVTKCMTSWSIWILPHDSGLRWGMGTFVEIKVK